MLESTKPRNEVTGTGLAPGEIAPGTRIEVWCCSLGKWTGGFEAVALGEQGWLVLRLSDRSELPLRMAADRVRRAPAHR